MNAPPRPEVIERLVDAAFAGMSHAVDGTTGAEVLSACMNIAFRAVHSATDRESFRTCIEQMYALLPERTVN